MRLCLSAKTDISDVVVDFIEVRLNTGEEVSLNWDESEISRYEDGFEARYKGVYFGEDYANGMIDKLRDLQIVDIGLYTEAEGSFNFEIEEMEFEDDDKTLTIQHPVIPPDCPGMEGLNPIDASKDPNEPTINITLTKQEWDMIKASLDVMGDRIADSEGYSSGEAYWDLKEKVAEADTPKHDTLSNLISSAQTQSNEQTLSLNDGVSQAYNALDQAIELADQYEAAGKDIHPSIGNRLMTAKLILSEVMNDLPKDFAAKDIEPAR